MPESSVDQTTDDVGTPDDAPEDAAAAPDPQIGDADTAADADVETAEPEASEPPIPDELRAGDVVVGQVAKLVDFGAFVDIPTGMGTMTGLVHVSEVAPGFVENIYAELGEGDQVEVKVLSIADDGKIGLSIKQADPDWEEMAELDRPMRSRIDRDFDRRLRKFMHGSQSIQGEVRRQKRNKLGN